MLNYKIANIVRISLVVLAIISVVGAIVSLGFAIFGDFSFERNVRVYYFSQAFYGCAIGCVLYVLHMAAVLLMNKLGLEPDEEY